MKSSELIVKILEEEGVDYIFGIPGGAIEDINIALDNSEKIQVIVTNHEEGAAFMADGFARVSGKLSACCATSGPGASNLITGLANSYADYVPVCALTGQVAISLFGRGAFQESGAEGVNIVNIFRQFTKYSCMLLAEQRTQYIVRKAVRMALSPPRGPVHISCPVDVMKKDAGEQLPSVFRFEGGSFDREGVNRAAGVLVTAERPVIIAGWGAVLSKGAHELLALAQMLNIPVATTPKAKGFFPESHPLSLGGIGYAVSPVAEDYILEGEVDVLLAVGTSFNEYMSNGWDERLNPSNHLIHMDIDTEKIGKNYTTSIGVVGDAKTVLTELQYAVKRHLDPDFKPHEKTKEEVSNLKKEAEAPVFPPAKPNSPYHPAQLVTDIQKSMPEDTIYFADVGSPLAWSLRYLRVDRPYSFYTSLGYGGMGYATAAAVGGKLAEPGRPVLAFSGDGSFLMNGFEVSTAVSYNVPVIWVIFNNAMLGALHFRRKNARRETPEGIPSTFKKVDFAKVAEGLGAIGIKVEKPGEITPEFMGEIIFTGRPTVIDVTVDSEVKPPFAKI